MKNNKRCIRWGISHHVGTVNPPSESLALFLNIPVGNLAPITANAATPPYSSTYYGRFPSEVRFHLHWWQGGVRETVAQGHRAI
eukprot:54356-Amphidinium_carterae.1